ncbi:MAG: CorA family divalent cation transporter [bacterium]
MEDYKTGDYKNAKKYPKFPKLRTFKHIKLLTNRKNKVGKLPTKFIQEKKKSEPPVEKEIKGKIEIFQFNTNEYYLKNIENFKTFEEELKNLKTEYNYIINIDTPFVSQITEEIKKIIPNFDELMIEDILNTDQRIKIEKRNELNFIVIKVPIKETINEIFSSSIPKIYEQFSILSYKNLIIIFQEGIEGDNLDHLRNNIQQLKENEIEFFLYYLIDLTVDKYLAFLEDIENYLIEIEGKIFEQQNTDLKIMYFCRVNLGIIKKDFLNLLETVYKLKLFYFTPKMRYYIQDLIDHVHKTIEFVDNLNNFLSYLLETHFSFQNAKLNQGIKLLTIINTIFVPAIFIASIYGMNFEYMPELKWKYGYFFTLSIIFSTIIFSLIYIKRKNL